MTNSEFKTGVTVLICTYNGASRLEPTLMALLNQKNTEQIPWEILLVDNASTDNTTEKAQSLLEKGQTPFTLLHEAKPGRDNALRTGFYKAKYEYICNVDDDTWVSDDYVYRIFAIMSNHPEVAVCGGRGEGAFEITPPEWMNKFQSALAIGPQGDKEGYVPRERSYLYGACAVYRKSLWENLHNNGFQFFLSGRKGKKLNSGEDLELCQAWILSGYKLWYDPEITFKHYMPAGRLTWKYFRNLFRAFGRADLISDQYFNTIGKYSARRTYILNHYLLNLLYTKYTIIKKLPSYLMALLIGAEGKSIVLETERNFALLFELLKNKKRYLEIRTALQNARWIDTKNR